MSKENVDHPIASRAAASLRRELDHLWTRRTTFDAICTTGELHVPQITSFDTRCKLVGLHPPLPCEKSGDHEAANIVIYIPENGRDPATGSEPLG